MIRNLLILAFTSLISLMAVAQTTSWPAPNRPITFINPFPPGGAVDAFGRPLAKQLSVQLNEDRKSTRLNSSHSQQSRMPSSA